MTATIPSTRGLWVNLHVTIAGKQQKKAKNRTSQLSNKNTEQTRMTSVKSMNKASNEYFFLAIAK
ncbi:MAG: hypothetical protein IT423_18260 [Pirellulaceae bacterium]|nr:hypothetical protein [Pirellulaceae bacterium]